MRAVRGVEVEVRAVVRTLEFGLGRAFVRSLFLLFLFALSSDSQGACNWYEKLAGFVFPTKRPVSNETYDKAKEHWDSILSQEKNPSLDTLLARLKEEGASSPESLMALMDSLTPQGTVSFKEWIARLEADRIQVRFRKMGKRESLYRHDDLKWRWNLSWAVPPLRRKAAILDVWLPETPPENAKDLLARFYTLSAAFPSAELEVTARKAPLLSLPIGDWDISYPKQLKKAVQNVEERVYETLHAWESRWDKAPLDLANKGTGNWHGSYATLPVILAGRSIYPFYNPVAKYRPTQAGYQKYKEGFGSSMSHGPTPLERDLTNRFQMRATEKYVVDSYLRVLQVAGSIALVKGLYQLGVALTDGSLQAAWKARDNFFDALKDPEKLNAALKAYEEDEEGNPAVTSFFEELIEDVKKEIAAKGDPSGKLAKQIGKLIAERDDLKN